jgi:hypothetical protein
MRLAALQLSFARDATFDRTNATSGKKRNSVENPLAVATLARVLQGLYQNTGSRT